MIANTQYKLENYRGAGIVIFGDATPIQEDGMADPPITLSPSSKEFFRLRPSIYSPATEFKRLLWV